MIIELKKPQSVPVAFEMLPWQVLTLTLHSEYVISPQVKVVVTRCSTNKLLCTKPQEEDSEEDRQFPQDLNLKEMLCSQLVSAVNIKPKN